MKKLYLGILFIFFTLLQARATVHIINTEDFVFNPDNINVVVGDTVRWTIAPGAMPHTTTSLSIPTDAVAWDAPVDEGHPVFDYVVTVLGTYNYKCTLHTTMTGTFVATAGTSIIDMADDSWFSVNNSLISQQEVNVSFNLGEPGKIFVQLYDASGNHIEDLGSNTYSNGVQTETYLLGALPKGIYMLRATSLTGNVTRRIVVQ